MPEITMPRLSDSMEEGTILKWLIAEGDEIMGSPSYPQFVEQYRERLQTVSASYCATGSQGGDGAVTVGLGLKGMIVVELTASGRRIALANPADTVWALIGVALFYLLITIPAGLLAGGVERKVAFAR